MLNCSGATSRELRRIEDVLLRRKKIAIASPNKFIERLGCGSSARNLLMAPTSKENIIFEIGFFFFLNQLHACTAWVLSCE